MNFDKLFALYGSVDSNVTAQALDASKVFSNQSSASLVPTSLTKTYSTITECIKYKSCSECVDEGGTADGGGGTRRVLFRNERVEVCSFSTEDGYVLESYKLLASK